MARIVLDVAWNEGSLRRPIMPKLNHRNMLGEGA